MRSKSSKIAWSVILFILILPIGSAPILTVTSTRPQSPASGLTSAGIASTTTVGPNGDIGGEAAPDRQRVETTIAIDPRNPSIIVAGAQDLRLKAVGERRWHGYYRSTDGGLTWSSSLLPGFPGDTSPQGSASPLHRSNATTDPVMAFDHSGNLYYAGIALNITGIGGGPLGGIGFVARYVNDGADYAGVTLIPLVVDHPQISVDTSGGPHDGNIYVVDDHGDYVRSADGGITFSSPFLLPEDTTGITTDVAGNVFIVNRNFLVRPERIEVTKLTAGGTVSAGTIVAASPLVSLPSPLPGNNFRVPTLPQIVADPNGVFIVWNDYNTGSANVLFAESFDGGETWSMPTRINDATIGQHFFPTITASGGIISIVWYDSRLGQLSNGTITGLDVFYTESTNAGISFSSNLRVTDVSFNPNTVLRTDPGDFGLANVPFMGDYIGIAAGSEAVHPIWADNRNACDTVDPVFGCVDQDAFTATISVTPPPPDFLVSASSNSLVVSAATATSNIIMIGIGGFAGTITVSATVTPAGLTARVDPASVVLSSSVATKTSTLTLATSTPGIYAVTVTGTNGTANGTHSTSVTVTVLGFSIAATPALISLPLESTTTSAISVTSLHGFTGTVALFVSITPTFKQGPSAVLSSSSVTLSSGSSVKLNLTLSAKGSTPQGTYAVTVSAVSHTPFMAAQITAIVVPESK